MDIGIEELNPDRPAYNIPGCVRVPAAHCRDLSHRSYMLICFPAMLKQLLVTLLVAAIVIVFARMKRARGTAPARSNASPASASSSPSGMVIAGYVLAAVMILATAGVTWMRYQEANEIVRVEVIDARSGERTVYQVRRKQLGEREFRTVDGRVVSLGASDRMERIE